MSEHLYDICEKHCVSSSCLNTTGDSERVDKGEKQVGINTEQERKICVSRAGCGLALCHALVMRNRSHELKGQFWSDGGRFDDCIVNKT